MGEGARSASHAHIPSTEHADGSIGRRCGAMEGQTDEFNFENSHLHCSTQPFIYNMQFVSNR